MIQKWSSELPRTSKNRFMVLTAGFVASQQKSNTLEDTVHLADSKNLAINEITGSSKATPAPGCEVCQLT
jgi:hypothetical protein